MDDEDLDARGFDELTPLPMLGPTVSPLQADLDVALATCNQLRTANAVLQAKNDDLTAQVRQLLIDRRSLAYACQKLKEKYSVR